MIYTFTQIDNRPIGKRTENVLAPHGFFIPCSDIAMCVEQNPDKPIGSSDRVFYLNSVWKTASADAGADKFDDLASPLTVVNLPFVQTRPEENLALLFTRTFDVFDENKRYVLSFEKVCGTFEVYVNGTYVGASEYGFGEFDVTPFVSRGSNTLFVRVVEEDGNKPIGIAGDVLLFTKEDHALIDYDFAFDTDGITAEATLTLAVSGDNARVKVVFGDGDDILDEPEADVVDGLATVKFKGIVRAYTAETPYLYEAYVRVFDGERERECSHLRFGFTDTKAKDGRLTINTVPFKIKGVVYKERLGADAEDELGIIKSFNFNTVVVRGLQKRSFYKRCTEMGLFVINEFPLDAYVRPTENGKKKKKKNAEEMPSVREYLRRLTEQVYGTIKSEPCVLAYSFNDTMDVEFIRNDLEEIKDSFNKPVENVDFGISENGFEDGRMPNVAYVRAEYVRLDDFTKTYEEEKYSGVIIDGFKDEEGKPGLFTAENVAKEGAVVAKYVMRPYTCRLADNRTIVIGNRNAFKRSKDLEVRVEVLNGSRKIPVATMHPVLQPGEEQDYSFYAGEYDEKTKLYVRFEENGAHLSTETLAIAPETVRPEEIEALKAKHYEYTVKNVEFGLDKLEENTLQKRGYFVPFSSEEGAKKGKPYEAAEKSDRSFTLSGEWDFLYYKENAPTVFGGESWEWKTITLPATWESAGYEEFAYAKGYPFKSNLKTFSVEEGEKGKNAVGIYRKVINVGDTAFRYVLQFMQVNGSIELQINGKYVGFSQLGAAEFDVTDFLEIGENEIVAIVKRWTPVSYLYARSGFLASGIVGDVRLVKSRKDGLRDYEITMRKFAGEFALDVDLSFFTEEEGECKVELKRGKVSVYDEILKKENGKVTVKMQGDFAAYDENEPYLYDLFVKLIEKNFITECVRIPIGFHTERVDADVALYNDEPLKVKGITYNAVYNALGEVMSLKDIEKDVALIKEYGFNTVRPVVRTAPEFTQIAMQYGLYVIGGGEIDAQPETAKEKEANAVMNNREFAEGTKRILLGAVKRDGAACNVIGFLFNENGDTVCGKEGIKVLKENTDLPVMNKVGGDVFTASFPSVNSVLDDINRAAGKTPLFLAEYASGEGVGCATVNEYAELIAGTPCCMGGCVDTFVDNVLKGVIGSTDGYFTAERRPYPGADCIRYLYRPLVSALSVETNTVEITNRTGANVTDKYINLNLIRDGAVISRTKLTVTLPPYATKKYDVFIDHVDGDMFLNVAYHAKSDDRLLYTEQHRLGERPQSFRLKEGAKPIDVVKLFDYVEIAFDNGYVRFNKRTGSIVRYEIDGTAILKSDSVYRGGNGFVTNLYRPFVRNFSAETKIKSKVRSFEVTAGEYAANVRIESIMLINGKETFLVQDGYVVNANGVIEVTSALLPLTKEQRPMDCFGKQIRLNNDFGNVVYYGNGATDNYIDMCEHTTVGLFSLNVDKTFEGYPVLQEVGNRTNVRYALVRNNDGEGLLFVAKHAPFQLRVSPYSDAEIGEGYKTGVKPKQSGVYVDINAFVSGIGTSEEGYPLPKFVVRSGKYVVAFDIIPVGALK